MVQQAGEFGVDICLVLPAFSSAHFPHLGTAVLKSACQARGLSTRILYGNLLLAAACGLERYDAVCDASMRAMLGERLYRAHAYPPETVARLPALDPLSAELQTVHDEICDSVAPALDTLVDQILALRPRILGVSSTFEQNLACGAVARRIKQIAPDTCIVMGGANVAWPICNGLAQAFPWVDHFLPANPTPIFPNSASGWCVTAYVPPIGSSAASRSAICAPLSHPISPISSPRCARFRRRVPCPAGYRAS